MDKHLATLQIWSNRLAIPSIIVSALVSGWILLNSQQIQHENAEIRRENEEIKHGQKDEWALKLVGMKNTAEKLEIGYKSQKQREAQYILLNRRQPCSALPSDLAVAEPPIEYMPPEAVYLQTLNNQEN